MDKKYFYGNEISEYGIEHGYVDYRCLAKAFDAVLANEIIEATNGKCGYWEPECGSTEYYEDSNGTRYYSWSDMYDRRDEIQKEIDELQEESDELEDEIYEYDNLLEQHEDDDEDMSSEIKSQNDLIEQKKEIDSKIAELESEIETLEEEHYDEVFQWFIVESNAVDILREANEIVYYNEELDLYLWGVTHFGTGWDYVLTDIKIDW